MKGKLLVAGTVLLFVACLISVAGCGDAGQDTPTEPAARQPTGAEEQKAPDQKEEAKPGDDKQAETKPQEQQAEEAGVGEGDTGLDAQSVLSLLQKGSELEGVSYESVMTSYEGVIESKIWMQGEKFKSEAIIDGRKMITIFDTEVYYTYDPQDNIAIKMPLLAESDDLDDITPLFDLSEELDEDMIVSVEDGSYDGVRCKIIVIREKETGAESKIWVRTDYGIPVRIESSFEGYTMTIENKNITVGKLPPDTFQLPPGVEIMDMADFFQ